MVEETPWYDRVVIPALLRHARTAYGASMRNALSMAGYDHIPANGLYVIGALALNGDGVPLSQLITDLRISKQSAGALVDSLVERGYLDRAADPTDRRRLVISLTARGRDAARIQGEARDRVDAELLDAVGERAIAATRKTLAVLVGIGRRASG